MTETKTTTFRLPSKYLVFLEMLAAENDTDRSKELIQILDEALNRYLSRLPLKRR